MAEYAFEDDVARLLEAIDKRRKIVERESEARHAGIDLEVNGDAFFRTAERLGSTLQGLQVLDGGDGRRERVTENSFFFSPPKAGHDEHARTNSTFGNGDGLFHGGDAEPIGSRLLQRL